MKIPYEKPSLTTEEQASLLLFTRPIFPKRIKGKWVKSWQKEDRIYASVCIIKRLLDICAPELDFTKQRYDFSSGS